MSNKKIYRGLNKRRRFNFRKYITIILCITLIGGYAYKKIKVDGVLKDNFISKNIMYFVDKLCFWKDFDLEAFKKKEETLQNTQEKTSSDTKVAIVEGMEVYLLQVGSFDNKKELEIIEKNLDNKKIPYSTLNIDGVNKTQAYISFEEEDIRNKTTYIKNAFSDAFLVKSEIPVLSLEYTQDYSYMNNIANYLNELLKSYKEESDYLNQNRNNIDREKYKNILTKRKNILNKLKKEVEKIDYAGLNGFKDELLFYTSQIEKNISLSLEYADRGNIYKSEGLLIFSIHKYLEFINAIK